MISRSQGHKTQTLLTQPAQRERWQAQSSLTKLLDPSILDSTFHDNDSPVAFFRKGRGVMRKQGYNEKRVLHHCCSLAGLTATNSQAVYCVQSQRE